MLSATSAYYMNTAFRIQIDSFLVIQVNVLIDELHVHQCT